MYSLQEFVSSAAAKPAFLFNCEERKENVNVKFQSTIATSDITLSQVKLRFLLQDEIFYVLRILALILTQAGEGNGETTALLDSTFDINLTAMKLDDAARNR